MQKREWPEQGYDRGLPSWQQAPGNKRGRFDGAPAREHGRGSRGPPPRDAPHFGGPPRFGHPMQKGPAGMHPHQMRPIARFPAYSPCIHTFEFSRWSKPPSSHNCLYAPSAPFKCTSRCQACTCMSQPVHIYQSIMHQATCLQPCNRS